MWALVFALTAVLGYVAVASPTTVHWSKAVIPVVVIVGAFGMTQTIPRGPETTRAPIPPDALLSAYECR